MVPQLHEQWGSLDFLALHARDAAFIDIDSQNGILHPEGVLAHEAIWRGARDPGGSLDNALRLATERRRAGIWLRYDRFIGEKEPGTPMDQAQHRHWSKDYRGDRACKDWEAELVEEVQAILQPQDLTLVYPAWSIFVGTPVLRCLSQWGSRTLLVSGCHTDWCVEMATRSARDLGYMPIVVGDACGTTHPVHEQSPDRINACYAPVVATEFAIDALRRAHNIDRRRAGDRARRSSELDG